MTTQEAAKLVYKDMTDAEIAILRFGMVPVAPMKRVLDAQTVKRCSWDADFSRAFTLALFDLTKQAGKPLVV